MGLRGVRARRILLIVHLASPIGLIPDVIPVLGYADGGLIAALAPRSVTRHAGPPRSSDTGAAPRKGYV